MRQNRSTQDALKHLKKHDFFLSVYPSLSASSCVNRLGCEYAAVLTLSDVRGVCFFKISTFACGVCLRGYALFISESPGVDRNSLNQLFVCSCDVYRALWSWAVWELLTPNKATKEIIIRLFCLWQSEYRKRGFQEVVTPNIYNSKLWQTSGHWQHYSENMFSFEVEKETFALKPMNCPGHWWALLLQTMVLISSRDIKWKKITPTPVKHCVSSLTAVWNRYF